ncbi:hypothetical protein KP509_19G028900 [Ceratopteris richardii]|uniref:Uncharacterized protein n=1 Tax=Ceratopteris richardii TaxID=49495 RepID=A0A8T2SN02_CERRI|nr:hypothetical protein KP509_19G028900 [Ceratopteris richardii]KAH7352079.1 hypothetical protein KP509_19G028900 [Ceratopteris richardii]
MTSNAREFKVKFLMSKEKQKIVYMEAGKEFVDVLLGLLQLPIVSALSFFATSNGENRLQAGSLTTLYSSLQKMNASNLLIEKKELLRPPCPPLLARLWKFSTDLNLKPLPALPATVYKCNYSYSCMDSVSATRGGNCRKGHKAAMTEAIPLDIADEDMNTPSSSGFVQSYLTFIVSDDLNIMPASTIESIIMLNKHGVKNLADLYSVDGKVSSEQVFELLRTSFSSCAVLNEVFKNVIRKSAIDHKV